MTHRDTPVSQVTDETVTEAAYKHYSTNFKREVNNLTSGNGGRATVCLRLNEALRGMIHHAPAISEKTRLSEFAYLDNFAGKTHNDLLGQYTQDNIYRTPLGLYKDNMEKLYQILRTPVTA